MSAQEYQGRRAGVLFSEPRRNLIHLLKNNYTKAISGIKTRQLSEGCSYHSVVKLQDPITTKELLRFLTVKLPEDSAKFQEDADELVMRNPETGKYYLISTRSIVSGNYGCKVEHHINDFEMYMAHGEVVKKACGEVLAQYYIPISMETKRALELFYADNT